MKDARVLIAGGGIGGLVAALALHQRGFEVSLYEQSPELHELGAGVTITPNGSRVLCELGLRPAIEALVSPLKSRRMRLFNTGETWHQPVTDDAERSGAPFWPVHRGDLHHILANALGRWAPGAIHVGSRCVGFEQDADRVTLLLEDGDRVQGDALIGADGVHSSIRRALFGEGRATFTGFMAWRAVVPMERLPAPLRHEGFVGWLGPRGQIVTYPMRRGQLFNLAATVRRDDWLIESWSEAGTVEECRRDFADWHAEVVEVIDHLDVPYKWALIGRPPLEHCSVGRVTLLGDACHPTLPILGQGANMTIEDGMILARSMAASSDVNEALQRYEQARLDRTSRIVRSSFDRAERMRSLETASPDQVRAFMDRQFSAAASSDPYQWIHEYDAMSAPV
ncbi:MAG TPA: FAD-dependent monooxygenase [Acetobacteraceae bacterium]|nr:FAD-dependent monooxygenase [Acetobacteraceae bacterium]